MAQIEAAKNHADDQIPDVAGGKSFAMQREHAHESKAREPRIVVCEARTGDADAALKRFINDWFVPALVEAYIRDRVKPPAPKYKDSGDDLRQ
jgi:hypothetical protein